MFPRKEVSPCWQNPTRWRVFLGCPSWGISLGCFVNGQCEFVCPALAARDRTRPDLAGRIRVGIHRVSITRRDAQRAGYPQTVALKISEGKQRTLPRGGGRARFVDVLKFIVDRCDSADRSRHVIEKPLRNVGRYAERREIGGERAARKSWSVSVRSHTSASNACLHFGHPLNEVMGFAAHVRPARRGNACRTWDTLQDRGDHRSGGDGCALVFA